MFLLSVPRLKPSLHNQNPHGHLTKDLLLYLPFEKKKNSHQRACWLAQIQSLVRIPMKILKFRTSGFQSCMARKVFHTSGSEAMLCTASRHAGSPWRVDWNRALGRTHGNCWNLVNTLLRACVSITQYAQSPAIPVSSTQQCFPSILKLHVAWLRVTLVLFKVGLKHSSGKAC